jgi:hypothetical protein
MKTAVCILAAWSVAVAADNKPNFSGEWKMNPGKSVLGPIPAPISLVRRVKHSDPSLTITEEQKGGSGDQATTRHYTTDGKPVTFEENGATVIATANWEGDVLVIKADADTGGAAITFIERMTLSNGGKTLTDALHIVTPQGELDATYSFEKQ